MARSEPTTQSEKRSKRSVKSPPVAPDPIDPALNEASGKPHAETKKNRKATVTAVESNQDRPAAGDDPRERIAARAYEIWESQGRPHGHDIRHWHQAERDVTHAKAAPDKPVDSSKRKKGARK